MVITILAILGTIAFISLQGYSADARDSKRLTETSDLAKKISIKIADGSYNTTDVFAVDSATDLCQWDNTDKKVKGSFAGTKVSGISSVDFTILGESVFRDPIKGGCDYNYAWGTSTGTSTSILNGTGEIVNRQFKVYTYSEGDNGQIISNGNWLPTTHTGSTDGKSL